MTYVRDCIAAAMEVNTRWANEAALNGDMSFPKSIDVLSLIRGLSQVRYGTITTGKYLIKHYLLH